MAKRDIIVVGGSAGGIDALQAVVRKLPADLPAAVFVVVHVPAYSVSRLPDILRRVGHLPVEHARDGDEILGGRILIAPPDRHMLVRQGRIELTRGPRENHSRPAIDPLFRSAARTYGERVIGVILSGALYDGASGLLAVKARGGIAIVQDPDEATVPSMPRTALDLVDTEFVLQADRIGDELVRLLRDEINEAEDRVMADDEAGRPHMIERVFFDQAKNRREGEPTVYTCPDCGGVMWQGDADSGGSFRCHVGHAYAPEVLLGQKSEETEAALWACVRLLRERATLTRQTAVRSHAGGMSELAERIEEQARLDERRAHAITELLESFPAVSGDPVSLFMEAEDERSRRAEST